MVQEQSKCWSQVPSQPSRPGADTPACGLSGALRHQAMTSPLAMACTGLPYTS